MNGGRTERDAQSHLWSLIEDIRFGMFTSRTGTGALHSRPLTTQNRSLDGDDAGVLWFFVSRSSEVAEDVRNDGLVNIAYANLDDDTYVSIAGTATPVDDPAKAEALWSTPAKAWFPGGPTDPDLQLIAVRIEQAEYWDVKSSKMTQLFKMAKAAVTGKPPTDMGEHRELDGAELARR